MKFINVTGEHQWVEFSDANSGFHDAQINSIVVGLGDSSVCRNLLITLLNNNNAETILECRNISGLSCSFEEGVDYWAVRHSLGIWKSGEKWILSTDTYRNEDGLYQVLDQPLLYCECEMIRYSHDES